MICRTLAGLDEQVMAARRGRGSMFILRTANPIGLSFDFCFLVFVLIVSDGPHNGPRAPDGHPRRRGDDRADV